MIFVQTVIDNKENSGLNPVVYGYEDCNVGHSYGPAVRSYWLVHFVVSGMGYYKIGDSEYNVGAGEMFVIPPGVETYYKADDVNPWNYIWIGFTSSGPLPLKLSDTIRSPEALEIFNLIKSQTDYNASTGAFLTARLWDLFALLLGREEAPADYIETALKIIHSEYMYDIDVKRLSERIGLDRCYFSTIFKKKMGFSPKQYILNYRMSVAASLMLNRGTSVSVTANSVGYSDIFNFSKAFKNHYGVSPSEYKKRKHK